ncbi:hypothetical protein DA075_00580 [Methylobacterium currus]|uniref:Uncharacterized protein n=1 Tax=Methylobacterium currus TaxID=2051553 RepID=A0A2R4WDI2_9HYPH|nr:hypothetical protein DA075_00580 [Methylobacterium currus]
MAVILLPAPVLAQAAQTTAAGLRLPQVIAGKSPAPDAGRDVAAAPPAHVDSLADDVNRPLSATAEPPPDPLVTHRPEPARR